MVSECHTKKENVKTKFRLWKRGKWYLECNFDKIQNVQFPCLLHLRLKKSFKIVNFSVTKYTLKINLPYINK